ncbi:hypothetical protein RFI_12807 [Reticulomyxa filosa]|uniref:Uncharacterized protein n=1 Tax=Reticulomyxa filosa TaxID=46433 RepID=X6NDE8_RETFI|nr:hypothetical protein RFI_12807 [Reticulomyxa filosa]|eukprot:ETO24355.1 hypothetical protein RFI_12807 [Reticulomyxa filosa]
MSLALPQLDGANHGNSDEIVSASSHSRDWTMTSKAGSKRNFSEAMTSSSLSNLTTLGLMSDGRNSNAGTKTETVKETLPRQRKDSVKKTGKVGRPSTRKNAKNKDEERTEETKKGKKRISPEDDIGDDDNGDDEDYVPSNQEEEEHDNEEREAAEAEEEEKEKGNCNETGAPPLKVRKSGETTTAVRRRSWEAPIHSYRTTSKPALEKSNSSSNNRSSGKAKDIETQEGMKQKQKQKQVPNTINAFFSFKMKQYKKYVGEDSMNGTIGVDMHALFGTDEENNTMSDVTTNEENDPIHKTDMSALQDCSRSPSNAWLLDVEKQLIDKDVQGHPDSPVDMPNCTLLRNVLNGHAKEQQFQFQMARGLVSANANMGTRNILPLKYQQELQSMSAQDQKKFLKVFRYFLQCPCDDLNDNNADGGGNGDGFNHSWYHFRKAFLEYYQMIFLEAYEPPFISSNGLRSGIFTAHSNKGEAALHTNTATNANNGKIGLINKPQDKKSAISTNNESEKQNPDSNHPANDSMPRQDTEKSTDSVSDKFRLLKAWLDIQREQVNVKKRLQINIINDGNGLREMTEHEIGTMSLDSTRFLFPHWDKSILRKLAQKRIERSLHKQMLQQQQHYHQNFRLNNGLNLPQQIIPRIGAAGAMGPNSGPGVSPNAINASGAPGTSIPASTPTPNGAIVPPLSAALTGARANVQQTTSPPIPLSNAFNADANMLVNAQNNCNVNAYSTDNPNAATANHGNNNGNNTTNSNSNNIDNCKNDVKRMPTPEMLQTISLEKLKELKHECDLEIFWKNWAEIENLQNKKMCVQNAILSATQGRTTFTDALQKFFPAQRQKVVTMDETQCEKYLKFAVLSILPFDLLCAIRRNAEHEIPSFQHAQKSKEERHRIFQIIHQQRQQVKHINYAFNLANKNQMDKQKQASHSNFNYSAQNSANNPYFPCNTINNISNGGGYAHGIALTHRPSLMSPSMDVSSEENLNNYHNNSTANNNGNHTNNLCKPSLYTMGNDGNGAISHLNNNINQINGMTNSVMKYTVYSRRGDLMNTNHNNGLSNASNSLDNKDANPGMNGYPVNNMGMGTMSLPSINPIGMPVNSHSVTHMYGMDMNMNLGARMGGMSNLSIGYGNGNTMANTCNDGFVGLSGVNRNLGMNMNVNMNLVPNLGNMNMGVGMNAQPMGMANNNVTGSDNIIWDGDSLGSVEENFFVGVKTTNFSKNCFSKR